MSTRTQKLGLFKYDTVNDSALPFDLNVALNDNWDIIDERCGSQRNIGEIVTSTLPLTDAGLHLLDGALIQGSGIYGEFVDYIAGLYGDGTNIPSYFTDENTWQKSITDYGVCGKFVYDSTNNTVRLPKLYSSERYLIDSSSSGTQWYRVYSDGWCEQGGQVIPTTSKAITVTFIKSFIDNSYSIMGGGVCNDSGSSVSAREVPASINSKNPNGFVKYLWTGYNPYMWQACGYIDISGYQNTEKYEYIVLATSTKTDIEVDIDNVTTEINNMVSKNDLSEVQCVVETYENGDSGYRIYSDGYCIQWGSFGAAYSSRTAKTITFVKPYKNTYYYATCTMGYTGDSTVATISAKTNSSITFAGTYNSTGTAGWLAEGYIEV